MNLTNKNSERPVTQSFTYATRFTASSSVAYVSLNPVVTGANTFFGDALVNFAQLYQQFRFKEVTVTIYPFAELAGANGNSQTAMAMGYTPMVPATAPNSLSDLATYSDSVFMASGVTVPVKLKLGKKQLTEGKVVKWFHTDTTPDPDTAEQGRIYYVHAGTNSTTLVAFWVIHAVLECRATVNFSEFLSRVRSTGASLPEVKLVPQPILSVRPDEKKSKQVAGAAPENLDPDWERVVMRASCPKTNDPGPGPSTQVADKMLLVSELSSNPNAIVRVWETAPSDK